MITQPQTLYIVATPIGNLQDITIRGLEILQKVDKIYAEDTRHSRILLQHHNIRTPLSPLHEHNENAQSLKIVEELQSGQCLALISDAGTPLISDPGFKLVRSLREQGIAVSPIPGPCALIAALSAAGLPTDRFQFIGFLDATQSKRQKQLENLKNNTETLIFYESPRRIQSFLDTAQRIMPDRELVLARELTKTFETFLIGTAQELLACIDNDKNQQRGEFVVLVKGAPKKDKQQVDLDKLITVLSKHCPTKLASTIAGELTGINKKEIYQQVLQLKNEGKS